MNAYTRPILVDVDTQLDFMAPTGALSVPRASALAPSLEALVEAARKAGIPHFATVDTHTPDDPEFAAYGFPPHCVKGTPGWARIPETACPTRSFEKATFDVFTNPDFAAAVAAVKPSAAIVCGVATDYCVKAAVLGLLAMGVPVLLVADAIASVAPETGEAALAEMAAAGAVLTSTRAVVAGLRAKAVAHVA